RNKNGQRLRRVVGHSSSVKFDVYRLNQYAASHQSCSGVKPPCWTGAGVVGDNRFVVATLLVTTSSASCAVTAARWVITPTRVIRTCTRKTASAPGARSVRANVDAAGSKVAVVAPTSDETYFSPLPIGAFTCTLVAASVPMFCTL